jgi:hypothetical protein
MTYGFSISNSGNTLIVDGVRPNYRIVESGTISIDGDPDYIGMYGFLLPNLQEGMYLVRPVDGHSIGMMNYYSGYSAPYNRNFIQGSSFTDILKYARAQQFSLSAPLTSDYGIQVYGASSESIYNSDERMFFVDAVLSMTQVGVDNHTTQTFTLPTPEFGERYFQLITRQDTGEYGAEAAINLTRNGETSVTISLAPASQNNYGGSQIVQNTFKMATGYFQ